MSQEIQPSHTLNLMKSTALEVFLFYVAFSPSYFYFGPYFWAFQSSHDVYLWHACGHVRCSSGGI